MPFSKQNNFLVFLFLVAIAIILSASGCKEGTEKSPVSSLLIDDSASNYTVDLSENEDATHFITGLVSSQNTSENLGNIDAKLFLNKQLVATTKTTSDGRFYFSKLPPGLYEIELTSSDDSYNKTTYIVRILDDGTTQPEAPAVKLQATNPERLKIQAKLEGEVVLAESGDRLRNINVELENSSGNIISATLTDSNGQFTFDGIGTGSYQLKVGKASIYEIAQQAVSVKDDGVVSPRYSIISISVKPTEERFPISGQVVSQNTSENLSNIMVSLFYNSQLLETTFTTADGNFYFARQIPGFYDLTFSSTDNKFKSVNYAIRLLDDGITQPEAPVVNLELTNPGTAPVNAKIEGEIIDSDTGEKLSNINIELVKADGTLHSTALTNANGYFYFDNLTSAEVYTIKAGKASNYTEEQQNVTIRNDNVVSPRYLIMRLGTKPIEKFTITGAVKTPENQAIINAEVKIFDDIDLTIPSAQATRTTGDGTFVFENLNEPRIYYIKVSETDLSETSQIFPVRILSNGTTSPESAEIFVTKKDTIKTFDISGKIYDVFSGGPLEYADVEIENNGIALTDVNGSFIIKNLVAGNYNVKISKFGYETTAASFHLLDDGTTKPETLAFSMLHSLKKGYGSIAGRYIDIDSGTGVTGLYIRLFKWQLTTKVDNVVDRIVDGNIFYKTISETDDQYVDSVLLTSKSSSPSDPDFIPEYAGSFKLTHLEPGKYLVYITTSSTVPNSTNEARGGYFTWKVPDKDSDPGFKTEIRNLEVLDGQTTYWTNYEQEYK